ncbi:GntR family transcriptional regulator [Mesorhizobium sp. WSM4887]|uniref:GntR family transcriptional regulator n=1 Tax=Mesorhizobium sp. WSM4887 TaxID=3038543 RepID=UPI002415A319|nr:GntR family transcriptional regulator [Mesorhizobium sp. WSM4887]MDG4889779.1 GntR family transcriptional regulator [Mesorhizobium sp. WSM4887]
MMGRVDLVGLPRPNRVSLSESVADSIAGAIAMRVLAPGERIVEARLVDRLGVSRSPIRESLKTLEAQGILTGGRRRGYRVAAFDVGVTRQIMEARLSLESLLLRDAIDNWRRGAGSVNELQGPIDSMRSSAGMKDVQSSLIADLDFHRAIRFGARNAIVGTLWDAIARHVLIVFNFDRYRDENLEEIPRQHEQFRDWIVDQIAKPRTRFEEIERALEDHMLLIERKKRTKIALGA